MLRQDVVEAITAGQFHLYAVATDAGLPILTGVQAGQYQPGQGYPDSVNGRVDALHRFAEGVMPCSVVQHRAATVCPGERRAIADR